MTDRERLAAIVLGDLLGEDAAWARFIAAVARHADMTPLEVWQHFEFGDPRIRRALALIASRDRREQ